MSDHEILQRWNNAVDQRAHVEILEDLNAVSKAQMHQKLVELGAEGLPEAPKRRARKAPAGDWVNPNLKIDERKAMELYDAGMCDKDIAAALGMSKTAICQWRKRMQLTPNTTQGGQTKLSDERVMELYQQGMSDREIGDAEGVTKATVRCWRERMGLVPNFKRRATGLDENRAWELYNEGLCDLDMAEALGVSRNTVADWRKKRDLKCHRQKPGYVQRKAEETGGGNPSVSCADTAPCKRKPLDRTGQDRTGQEGSFCWGGEACGRASIYGHRWIAAPDAANAGSFPTGEGNGRRALCA